MLTGTCLGRWPGEIASGPTAPRPALRSGPPPLRGSVQPGADVGLSNSSCRSAGSSNYNTDPSVPTMGSRARKAVVRPERFELPASWFVVAKMIL